MDERVRNDIAAAAAAHNELGRDYDGAVAEGLVERIGTEIDKRVDTRLAATERVRGRRTVAETDRHRAMWLGVGIGSAATGITALVVSALINGPINDRLAGGTSAVDIPGDMIAGLLGVWSILVVIYIVFAWVRHARGHE